MCSIGRACAPMRVQCCRRPAARFKMAACCRDLWLTEAPRTGWLVGHQRRHCSDFPNQVNNVLGFPYIFRGALDCRATGVSEAMKLAAARAQLTREPVPDSVIMAYGGKALKMGPDYFIPKPFDPRVLWW